MFDAVGTLMIGTLLILVAIVLGIETKSLLVGEGATDARTRSHRRPPSRTAPRSSELIHIKTLYLGPDELLVAAKLAFAADRPLGDVAGDIDRDRGARARGGADRTRHLPRARRLPSGDGPLPATEDDRDPKRSD